jgi:hypothetical protein
MDVLSSRRNGPRMPSRWTSDLSNRRAGRRTAGALMDTVHSWRTDPRTAGAQPDTVSDWRTCLTSVPPVCEAYVARTERRAAGFGDAALVGWGS